jgi:hypothetical protein
VLGSIGGRAAADALLDGARLLRRADRGRAGTQNVGRGRSLDRRSHVEVGRRGQIHRCGQVQAQVDIGIDIKQRKNFLVGKRFGALSLNLVH